MAQSHHFRTGLGGKIIIAIEANLGPEFAHAAGYLIGIFSQFPVAFQSHHSGCFEADKIPSLAFGDDRDDLPDRFLLGGGEFIEIGQAVIEMVEKNALTGRETIGFRRSRPRRTVQDALAKAREEFLAIRDRPFARVGQGVAGAREEIAEAGGRSEILREKAQAQVKRTRDVLQNLGIQTGLHCHSPFFPQNRGLDKPVHLYLHIPFCHRICPYCSFYKHTPGGTDLGAFVEALLAEARFVSQKDLAPLATIYFGGGTPSMLSPTHLRRLFDGLREVFDFSSIGEITLEANPATFTARTARFYEELGVTRVSLGVQSFLGSHLETLGREHTPMQAIQSVHLLREASSLEVNLDLIFSVPGQSLLDWEDTLTQALALQPDHLSAYNLTFEEDTAFFEKFQSGDFSDDPDLNAEMFLMADEILTGHGFEHYETSNYALPAARSKHNAGYWSGNDYLGLGPSAVSTLRRERWKNLADTAGYLQRISSIGHAQEEIETLDDEAWRLERLALMLRTAEGLPKRYLIAENKETISRLSEQGVLEMTPTHLRLIGEGPLLVDAIATELA